jgi:pimeloyl-ACP methyl ester carboxylesterase
VTAYVFVHSPLLGSMTWKLVVDELRQRQVAAIAPSLFAAPEPLVPYWQQHARAVAQAIVREVPNEPVILVGHSGGGMLLPSIQQEMGRAVQGYIFTDAGLPQNGRSRFDLFDSPESVAQFRDAAVNGLLTPWTSDDLREVIPDTTIREQFVADMRPMPLVVYEEPIPVFAGWPDAPCGYLQFSTAYSDAAQHSRDLGWSQVNLEGEHFHMLVAPAQVAEKLLDLSDAMRIGDKR